MGAHPVAVLGAVGVAAGFLSALFGVGGGIVVVPLLILAAVVEAHVTPRLLSAALGR